MTDFMKGSRRFSTFVSAGAALFTLAMMIHAARPWEATSSLGWSVLAFAVWALSPYGALVFMAYRMTSSVSRSVVVLVASSLIASLAVISLVYAFFLHLHSTSGLVFLSLPVLQLIGCAITWMILTSMRTAEKI